MINGTVSTGRREAAVRLMVYGAPGFGFTEIEAVIDTGFTEELTLPPDLIQALGLTELRSDTILLSDGSLILASIYEAVILWDGNDRAIEVQASDGAPLLGMSLLLGHLLYLPVAEGATLTISPLP